EELQIRKRLEIDLNACRMQKDEMEKSYESEKALVTRCRNDIVNIREDFAKITMKYESTITELKSNFKISLEKCELSVKSEKEINNKLSVDLKNFEKEIVQIRNQLTIA